jgi:hypothetical protein
MAQNLILNILAKDKTRAAFNGVRAGLTNLRSAVFSVQSAIAGIGGALVIRNLISVGSEVEQLGVRFNFLFGNVREGQKAFDGLIKFASRVPFSLEEISSASGNLAVVSKDADDLQRILKITGNVAAVTGLDFRTTAEQIQRSFSSGIGSADLFRERGVRALLGFQAGMEVTTEATIERFEELFGPNGKFGKATEVLSTTFEGTLSMLSDKLFKFKLDSNRAGFFDFIKTGLSDFNKLLEENSVAFEKFAQKLSSSLITATKNILIGTAIIADAIKPVFVFIGGAIKNLFDFIGTLPETVRTFGIIGFLMLGTKGKLLVVAIGGFLDEIRFKLGEFLEQFANFNQKILDTRKSLKLVSEEGFEKIKKQNEDILAISEKLKTPIGEMKSEIDKTTDSMGSLEKSFRKFLEGVDASLVINTKAFNEMMEAIEAANKANEENKNIFAETGNAIKDGITKPLEKLTDLSLQITNILDKGIKGFSRGIAESIVLGKELNKTFKDLARTLVVEVLATMIEIIARKLTELAIEKAITQQKQIQAVLSKIGGFFGLDFGLFGIGSGSIFRDKGGAVSKGKPFVVGERGPELFIPNQTGQITQNARGTSGSPVNVNFNINTVDASGFEELLVRSRGTITQLINNAVNERGRAALI